MKKYLEGPFPTVLGPGHALHVPTAAFQMLLVSRSANEDLGVQK